MMNVADNPDVARFVKEIEYTLPTSLPGLNKYRRLTPAEDFNDFLSDTVISYISYCDWDGEMIIGPGYVSLVVGIRADGSFRAEAWKITFGLDYIGNEEVLACEESLSFEEICSFVHRAYYCLGHSWEDSRSKMISRFNMVSVPGKNSLISAVTQTKRPSADVF